MATTTRPPSLAVLRRLVIMQDGILYYGDSNTTTISGSITTTGDSADGINTMGTATRPPSLAQ